MRKSDWLRYRWRLLEAGLGYRWVTRHLKELQDHRDDLLVDSRQRFGDDEIARQHTETALGSLDLLADKLIEHATPTFPRRHPILMTVLLPTFGYLATCILLLLVVFGIAGSAADIPRNAVGAAEPLLQATLAWLIRIPLPLLIVSLVTLCIRDHVPPRYWLTGVLLLCVIGSGVAVRFALPIPDVPKSGQLSFGFLYPGIPFPGQPDGILQVVFLLFNLVLAAGTAVHRTRKEAQLQAEVTHEQ